MSEQVIDMLLFCPKCAAQHIDAPKPNVCEKCGHNRAGCLCAVFSPWLNEPHKSHRCEACNHVWRPADVPTNGVAAIQTKGQRDGSAVPVLAERLGEQSAYIATLEALVKSREADLVQMRGYVNEWVEAAMLHYPINWAFDPTNPKGVIANIRRGAGQNLEGR